jgi:hypothetical protein
MTVGHLAVSGGQPSPADQVVHGLTWVSGAAGFVFLSGVSVGLVWMKRGGCTSGVRRWTLHRAFFLALVNLAVNGVGLTWFLAAGAPAWYPDQDPTLLDVLTSRWSLPFSDVLPMYAAFLIAAAVLGPWLVAAPRAALAGSVAVYAASFALPGFGPTSVPGDEPIWNLMAWQLLFMSGLVAGTRWEPFCSVIERNRRAVFHLGVAGVATIVALRAGFNLAEHGFDVLGLSTAREPLETTWLAKEVLGPLRVVLIVMIGPSAYLLSRWRLPVDRLAVSAGGRSLRVYVVSTLAAYAWPSLHLGNSLLVVDASILAATALVLATGLAPPVGRGRAWSF